LYNSSGANNTDNREKGTQLNLAELVYKALYIKWPENVEWDLL